MQIGACGPRRNGMKQSIQESGGQGSRSQEAEIGQTREHDIFETGEPILLQIGTSISTGNKYETINFGGQEVKLHSKPRPGGGIIFDLLRLNRFPTLCF